MATQTPADAQLRTIQLTDQQAGVVLDALDLLCNVRRYEFKQPEDDIHQTHRVVFEAARQVAEQIRSARGD